MLSELEKLCRQLELKRIELLDNAACIIGDPAHRNTYILVENSLRQDIAKLEKLISHLEHVTQFDVNKIVLELCKELIKLSLTVDNILASQPIEPIQKDILPKLYILERKLEGYING